MKSCCDHLEHLLEKKQEIVYDCVTRNFSMKLIDDDYGDRKSILYCPWCGTKLPEDLDDIWFKTLKEEFNIIDPLFKDADKVPKEFETDEWWRKRGL